MAPVILEAQKNEFVSANKRRWKPEQRAVEMPNDKKVDMNWYEISYNGKILKFTVTIFGSRPTGGYPLYFGLHGGGGRVDNESEHDAELSNNQAWHTLATTWYFETVKNLPSAMYIAPRGLDNSWNMHFQPESHILFEILIKSLLIPIEETGRKPLIDSNKIYLAGFSAGGDAVYRLATNMPDLFAAVNMSAGHPGVVVFDNLANLPICLQVGDQDDGHNRFKETVSLNTKLDKLQIPGHYIHEFYAHKGGNHSSWQLSEYGQGEWPVYTQYLHPPKTNEGEYVKMNTNAIKWVGQYQRNPIPNRLVWNLDSRPPPLDHVNPKRYFYWLYLISPNPKLGDTNKTVIRAEYDKAANSIHINEPNDYTGILLNKDMLKFDQPIKVVMGESVTTLEANKVTPSDQIRDETYRARGDEALVFTAMLHFKLNQKTWEVKIARNLTEDSGLKAKL